MIAAAVAVLTAGSVLAGPDADKIESSGAKIFQKSKMQGFDWTMFEFEGCEAWVVEPAKAATNSPWGKHRRKSWFGCVPRSCARFANE